MRIVVHVGTKKFGLIDMPYISVTFPPSLDGIEEITNFAPSDLRLIDSTETVALCADGNVLTELSIDNEEDTLLFMKALNHNSIMMVSLFTPALGGRFLLNRTIVSEMYFGRVISDTGPQTLVPVGDMIDSLKVEQKIESIEDLSIALDITGRGAEVRVLSLENAN